MTRGSATPPAAVLATHYQPFQQCASGHPAGWHFDDSPHDRVLTGAGGGVEFYGVGDIPSSAAIPGKSWGAALLDQPSREKYIDLYS